MTLNQHCSKTTSGIQASLVESNLQQNTGYNAAN